MSPRTYWAWASLCAAAALGAELAMGTLLRPGTAPFDGLLQQAGYAFTGLTLVLGIAVYRTARGSWARSGPKLAAACLPAGLFGIALWLGSAEAGRYARTFAALPLAMFLCLVPRPRGS